MVALNKVLMAGNLADDPELRATSGGAMVCEFTVALNRSYRSKQSEERVEEVAFVDVVAWGRTAEVSAEYLKKGRAVLVEGRLTQSRWESPEGKKMSRLRVTAESVQFMSPARATGADPEGGPAEGELPFAGRKLRGPGEGQGEE
ncbi:MAG: single-stranded DNA-binding protein [Planctomycetaceae bacterium]|nr:single-stranded DNA-binding protein [Planctomycetaceae bacterium]